MRNLTKSVLAFPLFYFLPGTMVEGIVEGMVPAVPDFNGIALIGALSLSLMLYLFLEADANENTKKED